MGRGGRGRVSGGGIRYRGGRDAMRRAAAAGATRRTSDGRWLCDVTQSELQELYVDAQPWYNRCPREERCETALKRAREICPMFPNEGVCQSYIELLTGCPEEMLEGLPKQIPGYKPDPLFPFIPKEVSACNMWKTLLQQCLDKNSHFDSRWKCVPLQGFVQDDCESLPPAFRKMAEKTA